MRKTVDLSLSTRTKQFLVLTLLVGPLVVPAFAAVLGALGLSTGQAVTAATVGWLVASALWIRRRGGDGDGDAWGGIPQWQYGGRFVEAGGLTKQEQEEALERYSDEE